MTARRRARHALALLVVCVACGDAVGIVPQPTDRRPILFVHGLGGSASDWAAVLDRFRADGWTDRELIAASYSSFVSNASVAGNIADRADSVVRATGWPKVTLITFSMGSLSGRYYLKNLGGTAAVESFVSVSGPNHGTETAHLCALTPCIEMRPGSAFLTSLNAGDETPGSVRYATWWSPCDQTIVPPESTILDGAVNTETPCLSHAGMFTETNYQQVKTFITACSAREC